MNWYVNQEVVCIKTHSQKIVIKDNIYVIKGLKIAECKCGLVVDIGADATTDEIGGTYYCVSCKNNYTLEDNKAWILPSLFRPLDELCNISELTEILTETKPFEV